MKDCIDLLKTNWLRILWQLSWFAQGADLGYTKDGLEEYLAQPAPDLGHRGGHEFGLDCHHHVPGNRTGLYA